MTDVLTDRITSPAAERLDAGTTVTDYGFDAVVLGYTPDGDVELCRLDGRITRHRASATPVVLIGEPLRQTAVLRAAVAVLIAERRRTVMQHAATLDQVRSAAIEKHNDGGEICRDGLNDFLRAFGMAPYEPQVRVHFSIHGSYDADTTEEFEAQTDAEDHLLVDLANVSSALDDSLSFKVEVTDVDAIGH